MLSDCCLKLRPGSRQFILYLSILCQALFPRVGSMANPWRLLLHRFGLAASEVGMVDVNAAPAKTDAAPADEP